MSERSIVEHAPRHWARYLIGGFGRKTDAPGIRAPRFFSTTGSLLQHQALPDAINEIFDPGLAEYIGTDQILKAFKAQAPFFPVCRTRR